MAKWELQLVSLLEQHSLGHLAGKFMDSGITCEEFVALQHEQYGAYGVSSDEDTVNLYHAIKKLRGEPAVGSDSLQSEEESLLVPPILPSTSLPPPMEAATATGAVGDSDDILDEKVKERQYTTRGTTLLMRTDDSREVKRRKSRIVVAVRKRPISQCEQQRGFTDVMTTNDCDELVLAETRQKVDLTRYTHAHRFFFDEVFAETASNTDVYKRTAAALIDTVFEGGYATCFAYGQTGSGKTHTMLGTGGEPGIYALAAKEMLARLDPTKQMFVSFYEIYSGKLYDLLNGRQPLRCLEDGKQNVNICGLTEHPQSNVKSIMRLIEEGTRIRSSGTTGANDTSSRSHAILEVKLRNRGDKELFGKFTFIDLAGSERGADTMDCDRQTRIEGAQINKSLLALKECIRSLDLNHKHVPFRGSKLTEVLRDSFVGNCRTVMIGAVSPTSNSCEHTLNTLRYADRVKELKKSRSERKPLEENEQSEFIMEKKQTSPAARLSSHGRLSISPQGSLNLGCVSTHQNTSNKGNSVNTSSPSLPKRRSGTMRPSGMLCGRSTEQFISESTFKRSREDDEGRQTQQQQQQQGKEEAGRKSIDLDLGSRYDKVVDEIVQLERECVNTHRLYLDKDMALIKEEFSHIMSVEMPDSNIDSYVNNVLDILSVKLKAIHHFQGQMMRLRGLLDEEEKLCQRLEQNGI
ncbi:MCAK-like kinesin, putative [Trypanosoma brucei gambiense DAL972]|uniref:Kinesin-like protein n=1 Tax=Trypanosoma brucei gambiense (strain MHOM/CI/86/DAL972) TaxID=679716 RepID=C9ZXH0_TRYB9|nr:MCAK-like kinesin, putative [Trypanosoma brucei gambiense DAL972]CBH14114.1 MCAK-like kinesin, putative [Trypanosoma brucei gambiense DAL972]|eukprot:XP_011776385.1 MCAK-like kinesin, putative [Trypanosoma brucei gambiense DAL972]